jgi:hypothetical protein
MHATASWQGRAGGLADVRGRWRRGRPDPVGLRGGGVSTGDCRRGCEAAPGGEGDPPELGEDDEGGAASAAVSGFEMFFLSFLSKSDIWASLF